MISPFYQESGITIYCGRAEEVLPTLPDKSFGTLLLDGPSTPPTEKLEELRRWMKLESRVIVLNRDSYLMLPGKLGLDACYLDVACQELIPSPGFTHYAVRSVEIVRDLLAECPSDPILDPYMGSGTTLVAAKMLNREAVGIERDRGWCAKAVERLKQV